MPFPFLIPLLGAGAGALINRKDPLKGAFIGGALGAGGAALPGLLGAGGATAGTVADMRENVNVVFIGHVDAGKSTISGQILFQTGRVDKRLIEKYEREANENNRESWWLAYVMDQIEEEKARGKTIEVGRALFDTPLRKYTILDAPGHK